MDIIDKLDITSDIITTESEAILFINKPVVLDQLPFIDPLLINDKYLTIKTPEKMLNYFKDLIHTDVCVLNGIYVDRDDCNYYCHYCKTAIEDDWFYCYHCNENMCKMCYEETSEEVALKNGAQNYKKREEMLTNCRSHNQIEPRDIYHIIIPRNRTCDLCDYNIKSSFFIAREIDYAYDDSAKCYKHNNQTCDICSDCVENNVDAINMFSTKSMQFIDINDQSNYYFGHTGFGSMLYWFPIISDNEGGVVLMNLNPDHVNYGKICLLSFDDHARAGYFIIKDEKYDLQKVLERLKEICDKGTCEYRDYEEVEEGVYGEEKVTTHGIWKTTERETLKEPKYEWVTKTEELSSPIHVLMSEFNMPFHYG
jgi:hypothetical protein